MTSLETLQKENANLKDLLQQVYEMSFLDDIIDDACRDRKDDEMLAHNLFLKSQITEALEKKHKGPIDMVSKLMSNGSRLSEVTKLKHDTSSVLDKHYNKEKNK